MKKIIIFVLAIIISILALLYGYFTYSTYANSVSNINKEYEKYLNKEIYGAELATIINKAIDSNENNYIKKDNKGKYIENDLKSIKIDIRILDNDTTYDMETFYYGGIDKFVKNYNYIKFKCSNIEYHKETKKIKKIYFEQITQ